MGFRISNPTRWAWFSPWILLGSVCILAGILLILGVKNIHREKEFVERALLSEANVLIRSIEAGSRTGMMGMGWGRRQHQMLLEETAQQSDVLYVALVNPRGQVVAHSDPRQVGSVLPLEFPRQGETSYRFLHKEPKSFEVARAYQPWFRQRGRRGGESCEVGSSSGKDMDLYILVGLDPGPLEEAQRQDLQHTLVLFSVMFLVGAAGFVSLVWAHHYRTARCSLKDIQAFTSTLVNQMPVGLVATDLEGRIERANEAARNLLRPGGGSVEGNIREYPSFLPVVQRLGNEQEMVEQEILCGSSGREPVPLLVNAAHIRDGEGRKAGFVFLLADMRNVKQLEEQLRRNERLAGLGRLAAGVAHEIRNPLSSIKGFATILAGRSGEDERSHKIAHAMVQEVERLNRVVTELLDFARPTELHKRPTACRELIENSLRLVEGDAGKQGVRVESRVEPGDLEVELDPDRFSQVLLNLYLNAIEAMETGGTLRVEVLREAQAAVFRITDTGSGIFPESLPHVFDPYFTTKPRGVGLGLANVHKFVEAHGGEVEVESTPGRGTRFAVRLPLFPGRPSGEKRAGETG
ncbi:MAG TPA: ATP-binding protein [Syntrophobacteraceae bacterium]|mgnify:CR=1 FL=1|nr:ATP-binding protein [Syntrophobacteraceae bacterium]